MLDGSGGGLEGKGEGEGLAGSRSSLGQDPLDDFAQVPSPPGAMVRPSVKREDETWHLLPWPP